MNIHYIPRFRSRTLMRISTSVEMLMTVVMNLNVIYDYLFMMTQNKNYKCTISRY